MVWCSETWLVSFSVVLKLTMNYVVCWMLTGFHTWWNPRTPQRTWYVESWLVFIICGTNFIRVIWYAEGVLILWNSRILWLWDVVSWIVAYVQFTGTQEQRGECMLIVGWHLDLTELKRIIQDVWCVESCWRLDLTELKRIIQDLWCVESCWRLNLTELKRIIQDVCCVECWLASRFERNQAHHSRCVICWI